MNHGIVRALLAAALFGASTPFAKMLVGQVSPILLAGLLYFGSGLGLLTWFGLRAALAKAEDTALHTLMHPIFPGSWAPSSRAVSRGQYC